MVELRQALLAVQERLGAAEVVAAAGLVREGRVFDLGTELARDMPLGPAETFGGFRTTPYHVPQALYRRDDPPPFDFSLEVVQGSVHQGSHIDAPAHIASRGRHFGGVDVAESYDDFGWKRNGIEGTPPIVGRGLLLDVPLLERLGRLPDGYEVTREQVQRCLAAQGLELRRGDVVLVRTGKFQDYHGDGALYFDAQPGVGREAAIWLYEQGMAALGTDTSATEVFPFPDVEATTHVAMLVERGVSLLEILNLEELAAARAYEFLFVCLPLRIRGGTGSWVRPVAVL